MPTTFNSDWVLVSFLNGCEGAVDMSKIIAMWQETNVTKLVYGTHIGENFVVKDTMEIILLRWKEQNL